MGAHLAEAHRVSLLGCLDRLMLLAKLCVYKGVFFWREGTYLS